VGGAAGTLIGASMMGGGLMPPTVYGGMVFVSAVTCLAMPLLLPPLLRRWPQPEEADPETGAPGEPLAQRR